MPRKNAKRTKRQSSNKSKPAFSPAKAEKDLMTVPSKLIAKLNKDLKQLKQKETKLKAALNKSQTRGKTLEARVNAATKKSETAAGRKLLAKAKKNHNQSLKDHATLSKQHDDLKLVLDNTTQQQAKWTALEKNLNQFERDWAKNSKSVKAKDSSKPKKATKEKVETSREQESQIESADNQTTESILKDRTEEVIS